MSETGRAGGRGRSEPRPRRTDGRERAARKESAWQSLAASWEQDADRERSRTAAPEPGTAERFGELQRTSREVRRAGRLGATATGGSAGIVTDLLLTLVITLGGRLAWTVLREWMSLRRAGALIAGAATGILAGAFLVPRLGFPEDRVVEAEMVGAMLRTELVALLLALLLAGVGGGMVALFAAQRREQGGGTRRSADGAGEARPAARRRRLGRAIGLLELLAVGSAWACLGALLTAQFFVDDGLTARAVLAGERPLSIWGTPVAVPLLLGTVLGVVAALLTSWSASNLSFLHRSAPGRAR